MTEILVTDPIKALLGRRIVSIGVSPGEDVMVFDTDAGRVGYGTVSDCCSETWFADLTGVSALLGEIVTEAVPLSMDFYNDYNVEDGRTRQERDEAYGYGLTTAKGHATLVYRNSSNGYYGGTMVLADPTYDGPLVPITDDWSA